MTYTEEQKQQIRGNLQKIVDYIEENILPYITYSYSTEIFGPIDNKVHFISLNNPCQHDVKFCHTTYGVLGIDKLASAYCDNAVIFLKHWQEAKSYMNNEIKNNAETIRLINNFEI